MFVIFWPKNPFYTAIFASLFHIGTFLSSLLMLEHKPLISIITVVYNGGKSLEKAVLSVATQAYQPIEYIVVDGGSSDNTLDIINKHKQHISRWISEKDNGIADAMNKGIGMATGDLIGFLNADDWLEEGAIEKVAAAYAENTVLYGDVRFWEKSIQTKITKSNHLRLRQGMTIAHPAAYVPLKVYKTQGLFNTDFKVAFDYDFILRIYMAGVPFKNINSVLVNMSLGGLSDNQWLLAIREELISKNRYFNRVTNLYFFLKQFVYLFLEKLMR
jgi:glycosyltransferase involved in cell wall biosynthesis